MRSRRNLHLLAALVLHISAPACDNYRPRSVVVATHPAYSIPVDASTIGPHISIARAAPQALLDLRQRLVHASKLGALASANEVADAELGFIVGAAAIGDRLLVADLYSSAIKAYTTSGPAEEWRFDRRIASVRDIRTVRISPDNTLLVVTDRGVLKIPTRGDSIQSIEVPSRAWPVTDGCVMHGRVYIRSASGSFALIGEIAPHGTVIREFGAAYLTGSSRLRRQLSAGRIVCIPEVETIIAVHEALPWVDAYSINGELTWRTYIANFIPTQIDELLTGEERAIRRQTMPVVHQVISAAPAPGGSILIQIAQLGPRSGATRAVKRLDTYLLSARDGRGVYVGVGLPPVLQLTTSRFVALTADKANPVAPQLTLYAY